MSLRDQIHRIVAEHDPADGPASIVDELTESGPFAGVAPDLVTDAVRHYADTAPLEQADDLSDFLASESDIGPLDNLIPTDEPFEGPDTTDFFSPVEEIALLEIGDDGYDDLGEADPDGDASFNHDPADIGDGDIDESVLDGADLDSFDGYAEETGNSHEIEASFEGEVEENFVSDEYDVDVDVDVDVENDAPDFDPGDIGF